MIAIPQFERSGVLYAPEMSSTVIEISMTDMDSGQWMSIRVLLDDFITYLEDHSDAYWGIHTPVRIRRVLERITSIEYTQLMYDFVRPYLPAPNESSTNAVATAGVFDVAAPFNPVWN